jgi:hypothetical protein
MSKERFHEIVKEMVELHDRKNRDYAGEEYLSNFMMCEKYVGVPAWIGCIIRLSDKVTRIMNLAKSDEVSVGNETITDTLMDLAIYAIITRILYEDYKKCNI